MHTTSGRVAETADLSSVTRRSEPVASVIDLFCGAGALSHGFLLEQFVVACGYDTDESYRFAFEANNDAAFVRKDVATLEFREVSREFLSGIPSVLIGCAPCQPFSSYSQGQENDAWKLLKDFGHLASAILPDIVSMENVPQLTRFRDGEIFNSFVQKLKDVGYNVRWMTVDCQDYGVPQTRSRLVLIASKHGTPRLPEPTHNDSCRVTVRKAIGDMPPLSAGSIDPHDPLHRASSMSETNLRRIRASSPGGTWRDWENDLVTHCHKQETGRGYASVYGRMKWNQAAPTITTQFYGFGNGRFGHPEQDRAISLREGAMLQTFPQGYKFLRFDEPVTYKRVGRMIGNAVPVALARAIARAVAVHLEEVL